MQVSLSIKSEKQCTQSYVDLETKCHDLFGWTVCDQKVSKPTYLSSWICIKVLLLKTTSQQGEIELPPELAKLKSESDFWVRLFRVSFHARWGLSGSRTYLHFFVLTLWDYLTERASHTILFTLFIVSCLVSTVWLWADKGTEGKRVLPNFWHKRLRHINNLRKRRLCTILLRSQSDSQSRYFLCISQFQLRKAPPPPGYCGAFANFVLPGGPSICQPRGHSRAFDTHAVSYQDITMRRILLGKKVDLLICQGHE